MSNISKINNIQQDTVVFSINNKDGVPPKPLHIRYKLLENHVKYFLCSLKIDILVNIIHTFLNSSPEITNYDYDSSEFVWNINYITDTSSSIIEICIYYDDDIDDNNDNFIIEGICLNFKSDFFEPRPFNSFISSLKEYIENVKKEKEEEKLIS